ncbi:MAG: riboflavin synthase [Alphaproteobacteria bacterium]|nr:riboflavin synthase [Alphaproteobacteria bacterium]
MFTGLVRDIGTVVRIAPRDGAALYEISTSLPLNEVAIGASVACAGVCLTVIDKGAKSFMVEVSNATLDRTTLADWAVGQPINLEPSLKMGDEIGGHLVTGHVDGVATLDKIFPDGASHRLVFSAPLEIAPMIAVKGSVAIDGVSMTVNMVDGHRFSVNVIPHTWAVTTLGQTKVGQKLNIEADPLARYVARRLEFGVGKEV